MEQQKQIDEMAKDIACSIAWDENEIPTVNCLETAKRLYCEGYRKQSEVKKHGKWVPYFNEYKGYVTSYNCSLCGRREPVKEPYCHCGAKMDEEG